ncbi:MAG TPA: hypothetical protein VE972_12490 [Conexibacter sp.]|nr:hypothetical protein [Conexibacter sp.]
MEHVRGFAEARTDEPDDPLYYKMGEFSRYVGTLVRGHAEGDVPAERLTEAFAAIEHLAESPVEKVQELVHLGCIENLNNDTSLVPLYLPWLGSRSRVMHDQIEEGWRQLKAAGPSEVPRQLEAAVDREDGALVIFGVAHRIAILARQIRHVSDVAIDLEPCPDAPPLEPLTTLRLDPGDSDVTLTIEGPTAILAGAEDAREWLADQIELQLTHHEWTAPAPRVRFAAGEGRLASDSHSLMIALRET